MLFYLIYVSSVGSSDCSSTSPLIYCSCLLNGLKHTKLQAHAQYTVHDIIIHMSAAATFSSAFIPLGVPAAPHNIHEIMMCWRLIRCDRYCDTMFDLPLEVCDGKSMWSLLILRESFAHVRI